MSSIMDKLKKNSVLKHTNVLSDSMIFKNRDLTQTDVPMINVALSGSLDGGLQSGLTVLAGPSKHFKTSFAFLLAGAFLNTHKDSIMIFYDSEFGSPEGYFKTYNIDPNRVLHVPVMNIEEITFDLMRQLEGLDRKDKVVIVIDSIGNLASIKEVEDALKESSKADMTRAKKLKGLFRMVTPFLATKDIPMLAINHTYQCGTEEMTVQTPDGNVSLASINAGDIVMTVEGWEEVSYTTTHEGAPITDIELEDGTLLSFTDGHRFKVNGKWKFVNELSPGDNIEYN